jgi:hypothetical protein
MRGRLDGRARGRAETREPTERRGHVACDVGALGRQQVLQSGRAEPVTPHAIAQQAHHERRRQPEQRRCRRALDARVVCQRARDGARLSAEERRQETAPQLRHRGFREPAGEEARRVAQDVRIDGAVAEQVHDLP